MLTVLGPRLCGLNGMCEDIVNSVAVSAVAIGYAIVVLALDEIVTLVEDFEVFAVLGTCEDELVTAVPEMLGGTDVVRIKGDMLATWALLDNVGPPFEPDETPAVIDDEDILVTATETLAEVGVWVLPVMDKPELTNDTELG